MDEIDQGKELIMGWNLSIDGTDQIMGMIKGCGSDQMMEMIKGI